MPYFYVNILWIQVLFTAEHYPMFVENTTRTRHFSNKRTILKINLGPGVGLIVFWNVGINHESDSDGSLTPVVSPSWGTPWPTAGSHFILQTSACKCCNKFSCWLLKLPSWLIFLIIYDSVQLIHKHSWNLEWYFKIIRTGSSSALLNYTYNYHCNEINPCNIINSCWT